MHQFEEYFAIRGLQVANLPRQVEHFVFALVVVRRWLDEKMLPRLLQAMQAVVAESGERVRKDAVRVVLHDAPQLDHAVELLLLTVTAFEHVTVGHEGSHAFLTKFELLASLGRELHLFCVLSPLAVLEDDEGVDQRHYRLVERVHQDELARGAHELFHLRIEVRASFVAQLVAPSAF